MPQPRTIPRPELPAAKLTIRRAPEGVKISKGGARLLASRESSVASNLCVLCHFQSVIYLDAQIAYGALDLGMAK